PRSRPSDNPTKGRGVNNGGVCPRFRFRPDAAGHRAMSICRRRCRTRDNGGSKHRESEPFPRFQPSCRPRHTVLRLVARLARFSLLHGRVQRGVTAARRLLYRDKKPENHVMKSFKVLHLTLALAGASLLGGCFLTDGGKTSGAKEAQLVLSVGVKDVNNLSKPGLAKTAAGPEGGIVLSRLVITLTSSVAGDAVIRDTIVASDTAGSTFTSASDDDQQ